MDFLKYWNAFLHWKGWTQFGVFCAKLWKNTLRWSIWRRIFGLPFFLLCILGLGCCAGLVWIFTQGREQSIPAYGLYVLSAYALVALCVRIPGAVRLERKWLSGHPKVAGILQDRELKFRLGLYLEQLINFGYGIYKIAAGVLVGSAWIGSDGIYNMAQALIQLFQILRRRSPGTKLQQWRSYRVCGGLILLMHLTLTGIVFQMVNWNRVEEQGEVMIIATAAFAFYKVINSFISIVKDRKHPHPIDSSVRMLELSQAIFAIFSLQAGLLHTFGTGERWEGLMNLATGSVVCMMTAAMGIYMIRRASREMKQLQEIKNGE